MLMFYYALLLLLGMLQYVYTTFYTTPTAHYSSYLAKSANEKLYLYCCSYNDTQSMQMC